MEILLKKKTVALYETFSSLVKINSCLPINYYF